MKMNKEELFDTLVNDIQEMYENKISETEAYNAIRNCIKYIKIEFGNRRAYQKCMKYIDKLTQTTYN